MLTKIRNLENQDVLSCHAAAAVFRRRTGKGARGAAEMAVVFRFARFGAKAEAGAGVRGTFVSM